MEGRPIEEIIIDFPRNLGNSSSDANFLANLWHSIKNRKNTKIVFDIKNTNNFSINVCSSLGLILEKVKLRSNKIYFRNVPANLKKILVHNDFLKCIEEKNDNWNNNNFLAYKKFNIKEKESFEEYLIDTISIFVNENSLNCNIKDIVRATSEIFVNVKMHTKSNEVVTCGYYDNLKKEMYFTISNHGITIAKNIEDKNGYVFNKDVEAIEWALKKSNSTRDDTEIGGLGFYKTREFIKEIKGNMWICSGRGYWYQGDENTEKCEIKSSFPGTSVTFKIPLDDMYKQKQDININIISLDEIIGGDV